MSDETSMGGKQEAAANEDGRLSLSKAERSASRITMPRNYTLRPTFFQKHGFAVYLVAGLVIASLIPVGFRLYHWRYFRDYTGETEAEVLQILGEPYFDSRLPFEGLISLSTGGEQPEYKDGEPFSLVWTYYVGGRFSIDFEDGVAVRQSRYSK